MKAIIIAILLNVSFQVQSQISDCNSSGSIDGILVCMNTIPELKCKYGYKKIITYSNKNRLNDYKQSDYYSVYEYIDSTRSIRLISFWNGKISPHECFFYFDHNNKLIKEVSIDSSKVRYSYRSLNYIIDYIYKNNLLAKKVKYEDGQFLEQYSYSYNNQGLLTEIYRQNSEINVLIQKNSYNKQDLKDTIFRYAFIGNHTSWQAFKYDSLGNIIEETYFLSDKKQIMKTTYAYVYDSQSKILDKIVKDSEQENSVFHWKYEYKSRGKKEIYTEYHKDSISHIGISYYNEKNNLVYSITKKGFSKGRYVKYLYDQSGELILYIERDSPENRDYRIYE